VGKDTVSRVWRKVKGDWDAWNGRSLADEPIVRAVSFLKARESQDAHAGYSGPLDEQRFLVETINHLQRSPQAARSGS
jgi:hypothetical protein